MGGSPRGSREGHFSGQAAEKEGKRLVAWQHVTKTQAERPVSREHLLGKQYRPEITVARCKCQPKCIPCRIF